MDNTIIVDNKKYSLYTNGDGVQFYVCDSYNIDDIKKVQKKSVEMMQTVVGIFEKHGIDYVLAHGTLLGLIRHGGFIPWDDDCDLFVFDWDYARAIELLRRELPRDMIVHNRRVDPVYWPKWTKIRDLNSDTYESLWAIDRKFKYHGICVDVLKVTVVSKNKYLCGKEIKELKGRVKRRNKRYAARESFDRLKAFPRYYLGDKRDNLRISKLKKKAKKGDEKLCVGNKDTIIECSFEYNDVFPTKKMVFEGVEVAVPNKPENVLRSMYGDFMRMPDVEDRKPHFDKVVFLNGND
jgi:lipopolysaccharide cholinephosphotransferase